MTLDAEAVASGRAIPQFARADYERAMLTLAESSGDDPVVAFAWLCATSDVRMQALYTAARVADMLDDPAKQRSLMGDLLARSIRLHQKDGESTRNVLERLMTTDNLARDSYAQYAKEAT